MSLSFKGVGAPKTSLTGLKINLGGLKKPSVSISAIKLPKGGNKSFNISSFMKTSKIPKTKKMTLIKRAVKKSKDVFF